MPRRLKVLTWHVHGNYLWYLSQAPHDFYLVTDRGHSPGRSGRNGTLPWGDNVFEAPVAALRRMAFDLVLFQSRREYEEEQYELLSAAQLKLPRIYLEHDPPREHPTDTRHWVDDPNTLLVHCTNFNALMWNSGRSPVRVIEHGVKLLTPAQWNGRKPCGVAVVNNLDLRGRRLGADIFKEVRAHVPIDLVGLGAERMDGLGTVENTELPAVLADYRFFFNPIRYTSFGLALIEAMMVGLPIVALATTEVPSVIRDGENGFCDLRLERLMEGMNRLIHDALLARSMGEAARRTAEERFNITRFAQDWTRAFELVAG
jgi:glycosyltransferase involved in cell wall biosynthesis